MSFGDRNIVEAFDSSFSEVKNESLISEVKNLTSNLRTLGGELSDKVITDNITQFIDANAGENAWISQVTRKTVHFVHNVTENSVFHDNRVVPQVITYKPEVHEEDVIGTAEKVVLGAVFVVVVLAITAIVLRLCRARCTSEKCVEKDSIPNAFGIEVSNSKLSGYANLEVASNSSTGTGSSQSNDWSQSNESSPSTDWSDLSSDVHRNFEQDHTEPEMPKKDKLSTATLPVIPGGHVSSHLLRSVASEERLSAKSSPLSQRHVNDEALSVISSHSLEPLRFEQAYRNRWDDQWDPYGSLNRGQLSHFNHPSESRLSLNSFSSHSSNTTFPIPNKDTVQKLNMDKSNRYPSNLKLTACTKKEKHVRMSPPTNR